MNNWNVELPSIRFVIGVLESHKNVESFDRESDILFTIERKNNMSVVTALFVNRYTIGLADVLEAEAEFPNLTCIVAIGNWCGYTEEAKRHGFRQGIGVFNISEFSGALWKDEPLIYAKKGAKGLPIYAYRNS